MKTRQIPAHEVVFSQNIYWYGMIYTVLGITSDEEDGTVTFKVGYPRKIKEDAFPVPDITCPIQRLIDVY